MPTPRSYRHTFRVGHTEFYHHHAEDAHGTVCDTYMTDDYTVNADEFYRILREELGEGKDYICLALGLVAVR